MTLGLAIVAALAIAAVAAWLALSRARRFRDAATGSNRPNSLPSYHALFVAIMVLVSALVAILAVSPVQQQLVRNAVMESPEGKALPDFDMQREAILVEAREIAAGQRDAGFNPESGPLAKRFTEADARYGFLGLAAGLLAAIAGAAFALRKVKFDFRARRGVERFVMILLVGASLIAVLTTLGIVLSLLFESILFFKLVSPVEFLTGSLWSPAGEPGHFGSLGLFWGTAFIGAIIAMIVAVPLGLMSAIYLTQYAAPGVRRWFKPALEILAGVPTVVYGYFAALTIGPAIRDVAVMLGISSASSESALAAGLVMGVMIIPLISSMSDDSITAVPQAMRDGSLALGATKSETIKKVVLPAALPGVVGGILLAVSRAIGETMIVVMAAGLASNLTANPFASVTTVTVQIVQLLTGDQEFDSAKTLAAFALGLVLFIVTLALNLVALRVVRKYREAYE
jgi:phosphate transport system permease protein